MIYIITNRPIKTDQGKDAIDPRNDAVAEHVFRIAMVTPPASDPQLKTDHGSDELGITLLPDYAKADYRGLPDETECLAGTARMFVELYTKGQDKHGHILVVVPGFNYSFEEHLAHLCQVYRTYLGSGSQIRHLIYVSWPSAGSLLKYRSDQRDARVTGMVLGRLFCKTGEFFHDYLRRDQGKDREPCLQQIHLLAHSMGNEVVHSMLQSVPAAFRFRLLQEVVLCNADCDWDGFGPGQPLRDLIGVASRVHVYVHRSDDALRVSRGTKNHSARLGLSGPRSMADLPEEVHVVDTTNVEGTVQAFDCKERGVDHWGYIHRPGVIKDIQAVFQGVDEDLIRGRKLLRPDQNWYTMDKRPPK